MRLNSFNGAVTLKLGNGAYSNSATGYYWQTNNQNLRLESSATPTIAGVGFKMGSGHFTSTLKPSGGFGDAQTIYVSNSHGADGRQKISASDPTSRFFTLAEIAGGFSTNSFTSSTTGTETNGDSFYSNDVSYTPGAQNYPVKEATIIFWDVRNGELDTSHSFANTIRFGGQQNSFTKFKIGDGSSARLIVNSNTILNGSITVGTGGIDFEAGATARSGTIKSLTNSDLKVNFLGDFVQMSGDAIFSATGATLLITSNGNSVRLLNRGNVFAGLDVSTSGGNFQIAASRDLSFSKLDTAGGWVVLDTAGSISGTGDRWLSAGSVSFRAGGSVVLKGSFASASGTGASVSLINSAAGSVLGGIRSDSSVTIGGSGQAILVGDIIGGSSVTVGTSVAVAQNSAVVASGGRVEFVRTVAALNALAGLRVDAGYGGIIALGGSIGSPSLSLGWVELTGEISNTTSQGVFFTGGNRVLTHGGKVKNWRNGSEF